MVLFNTPWALEEASSLEYPMSYTFNWWILLVCDITKHSLNSTQTKAELVLFSDNTEKIVKWNKTLNTSIEDFKYFIWGLQILLAKLSLNSISTHLNLNSTQP